MRKGRRMASMLVCAIMLLSCLPLHFARAAEVEGAPLSRAANARNGMVRVYLSSLGSPSMLDITVAGSYTADGARDMSLSTGETVRITFSKSTGQITMIRGGASYDMGREMAFRRHATNGSNGLKIAQARQPKNLYPGDLYLTAQQSGSGYRLYAIVHVYIENYLYGVVPYEMGNSANIEALKAQAVAARTYTLNKMNIRSGSLYDVVDTTNDQVYYGNSDSTANCTAAVNATKGIVVMNDGKLTGTYYTASNGGQTESARNLWGSSGYDYLTVKDDPFDQMNPASVKRTVTVYADNTSSSQNAALKSLLLDRAKAALRQKGWSTSGAQVTRINGITPHTPKYPSPSRLYTKLDFDVTAKSDSGSVNLTLTFDIFSELESALGMSINSSKNELWSVEKSGNAFKLQARRFGHGIGMSQRGAMQMGSLGYTYDQILGFYYENCTRVQYTFTHTILSSLENGGGDVITSTEDPAEITPGVGNQATVKLAKVGDRLAVRSSASGDGAILTSVINGGLVTVLAKGEGWTLIRLGQIVGYVPTSALKFTGTPPTSSTETPTPISQWATVSCTGTLNLRSEASTASQVISSIPDGAVLCVFNASGGWARVQYGASVGWASMDFLTLSSTYPGQVASESSGVGQVSIPSGSGTVNLRETASTGGRVLTTIPHGTSVTVLTNDGSWCFVRHNGVEGYVMTEFLSIGGSSAEIPEVPDDPAQTPSLGAGEIEAIVKTAQTSLNLREQPNTSSRILTTLPRGESIVVTNRGTEWCAVRYGGMNGYVMTQYLSFPADQTVTTQPTVYATVNTASGALNMRTQATTGSSIVLQIPRLARVGVLEKDDRWCRVTYNGSVGYVMASYLAFEGDVPEDPGQQAEPAYAKVTTASGSLNMRERPSTDAKVLTTIPRGTGVAVINRANGWSQVAYNNLTGYVMEKFLTYTDEAPAPEATQQPSQPTGATATVVTGGGSLNLRGTASAFAPVLTTIPEHTVVQLITYGLDWSQVSYQGFTGYVMTQYIRLGGAVESTPVSAYVSTASGALNLRETDSTQARVVTTIPRGALVSVLQQGSTWCHIRYQSTEGYVMTRYLDFDAPPADAPAVEAARKAWITTNITGGVNLRQKASTDAAVLTTLPPGAEMMLEEKGDVWCKVSYGAYAGYVQTRFVVESKPEEPTETTQAGVRYVNTTTGGLNLRAEASMDAQILGVAPRSCAVTLLEEGETWSRIQYNDVIGWVMTAYLSHAVPAPLEPEITATPAPGEPIYDGTLTDAEGWEAVIDPAEGSLNLRAYCSTEAAVLTSMPKGETVTVLQLGDEWCKVRYKELEGYCATEYLTLRETET